MVTREEIQGLYDEHRYLEAHRRTLHLWTGDTPLERLTVDDLVLGGRLANRLGGWRLSRWLLRAALERAPDAPLVRYFTGSLHRRGASYVGDLRRLEVEPELATDDPELQSSWLASSAVHWASLRDFERAHDSLERARSFECRDGWVASCESDVLGLEDRWRDALDAAARSWQLSPGAPFAARSLGSAWLNLGEVEQAADHLERAATHGESYELSYLAAWFHAAHADTLQGEDRTFAVARARAMADALPGRAPLIDRESRASFAGLRLMIAELADDHDEMERWATEARSPFYLQVLDHLRKHPGGARVRLPFRRDLQKHMACLPTSLGSALATMGEQLDTDVMASEVTYGGTIPWAAGEWLEKRGLVVRYFVVTPELARSLIRDGIAFVLSLDTDDFSHAVAVVGIDDAAGTLLVHDPQQFRTQVYLQSGFDGLAPTGPRGMVAVPPEKQAALDALLPAADVEVMTKSQRYLRALQLQGPTIASAFLPELEQAHPSHPETLRLRAIQAAEEGRTGAALSVFQELLNAYPGHTSARMGLIQTSRSLGNTGLLLETLRNVVERRSLPGVNAEQEWRSPPSSYVSQYADLLRLSEATIGKARALLESVLRRQPIAGDAWHILGDLLWQERDFDTGLLCYRVASCLEEANDHYAHAYAESLAMRGRLDDGLEWLERRARRYGASPQAIGTWTTWIGALEHWGRPDKALVASDEALAAHGEAPELVAFVIPFFVRMGRWEDAEALLERLRSMGNAGLYHEAAVELLRMQGALDDAIRHAESWIAERPLFLKARHVLLDLVASRDGAPAAVERGRAWVEEHPSHENFEELYCLQLDRSSERPWRKVRLLRRRLRRNPEDAWAWRELAFGYLQAYGVASDERRSRLAPRIDELVAECERTGREDASTVRLIADWAESRGRWQEATELWLDSIVRDPATSLGYRRAWDASTRLEAPERQRVWQRMETLLLGYPGRLLVAREVTQLAAQRFGVSAAEATVSKWKELRPDDPEITEALCDLLVEYGHGRSDAARALSMLEPAVERFPFHFGLRFSLLVAYRALGRLEEAEAVVPEIIRRHPGTSAGRIQLALIHQMAGRDAEARRALEQALEREPRSLEAYDALARLHLRNGRLDEARRVVLDASHSMPESVGWRDRAFQLLAESGFPEDAIAIAREGVEQHPTGAHLWYGLGSALSAFGQFAARGEVEACLRKSLELNPAHFDAADGLAVALAGQKHFTEAEEILRAVEPRLADPSPARGRLAWLRRVQGEAKEALDDMVWVLERAPWYQWGWSAVMEWLAEDEAWETTRRLLATMPPEIRTDVPLLRSRLSLLEAAGIETDRLDAEWDAVLRDFAEEASLHLVRYDSLQSAKRYDEAASVIRKIHALEPEDPFVNARLVQVLEREGKRDEAIEALLRVSFAPTEESEWPVDFAWSCILDGGLDAEAYRRVTSRIKEGARPTPRGLHQWAHQALRIAHPDLAAPGRDRQSVYQFAYFVWFPLVGVRDVLDLLRKSEQPDERYAWVNGRDRAILFAALTDYGYGRVATTYWKQHPEEVDADPELWAQTCQSMIRLTWLRRARRRLSSWPERSGVSMWVVTTYVECLPGATRGRLEAVRESTGRALRDLPHDHTGRYLAHLLAESQALLGDPEGVRRTWSEFSTYFDGELLEGEYFSANRDYLLTTIPQMVDLLERGALLRYRWLVFRLWWKKSILEYIVHS